MRQENTYWTFYVIWVQREFACVVRRKEANEVGLTVEKRNFKKLKGNCGGFIVVGGNTA